MDNRLRDRLEHLRLGQYVAVLQENGYVLWGQLKTVTEEDFSRLGFKLGHRRRLQRAIATMEGYPRSEALPSFTNDTTKTTPLQSDGAMFGILCSSSSPKGRIQGELVLPSIEIPPQAGSLGTMRNVALVC